MIQDSIKGQLLSGFSVWNLKAGIQQGARNHCRAITGPRSSCRGYRIRLCSLEGLQGNKWRDKEPSLGISVHIPVLPTLPQRVIIDSDTRLLYNKAYNWAFFFLSQRETSILWDYSSPVRLSRPTGRGNSGKRTAKEKKEKTPKIQRL